MNLPGGESASHPTTPPDEVNRLWQHGMHEERLFHDRLNYFSFLETGLLTLCVIMYNKEPSIGFFLPVAVVHSCSHSSGSSFRFATGENAEGTGALANRTAIGLQR